MGRARWRRKERAGRREEREEAPVISSPLPPSFPVFSSAAASSIFIPKKMGTRRREKEERAECACFGGVASFFRFVCLVRTALARASYSCAPCVWKGARPALPCKLCFFPPVSVSFALLRLRWVGARGKYCRRQYVFGDATAADKGRRRSVVENGSLMQRKSARTEERLCGNALRQFHRPR